MRALKDCVIIERDVEEQGMFILPPGDPMETGKAIAVGPDCKEVCVGDQLYFGVGQEFSYDKKEYVVMREQHITGVFYG